MSKVADRATFRRRTFTEIVAELLQAAARTTEDASWSGLRVDGGSAEVGVAVDDARAVAEEADVAEEHGLPAMVTTCTMGSSPYGRKLQRRAPVQLIL